MARESLRFLGLPTARIPQVLAAIAESDEYYSVEGGLNSFSSRNAFPGATAAAGGNLWASSSSPMGMTAPSQFGGQEVSPTGGHGIIPADASFRYDFPYRQPQKFPGAMISLLSFFLIFHPGVLVGFFTGIWFPLPLVALLRVPHCFLSLVRIPRWGVCVPT